MKPGVRMRSVAHAKSDVRTRVVRRIRWCRNETIQVKIRISRQMYDFLTRRLALKFDRCNRFFHTVVQHFSKILRLAVQQCGYTFPACQNTDRNTGIRMPFYIVENHRRTFFRRTFYGSARADVSVNTGQLRHRVNLDIRLDKLPRHVFQSFQRTAQISYFFSHNSSPFISTTSRRILFHLFFYPHCKKKPLWNQFDLWYNCFHNGMNQKGGSPL